MHVKFCRLDQQPIIMQCRLSSGTSLLMEAMYSYLLKLGCLDIFVNDSI